MKLLNIRLDAVINKKLKVFAVMNDVSYSEIVRVLLLKSKLKIKTRDKKTVIIDGQQTENKNVVRCGLYLNDDEVMKLKKMHIENNASYSEIIRQLIANTDLDKLKFKTKGENILAGKGKKGK